jgi:hypothetical protein
MRKSVEELTEYIRSDNPEERRLGLVLVGKQQEYALLPWASRLLLVDEDENIRALAAWALDKLGSPVTVPALIEALYDPAFDVRSKAGWALVHIAERTIPLVVVPDVVEVLCNKLNADARQMAYLVLHSIGDELSQQAIEMFWHDD